MASSVAKRALDLSRQLPDHVKACAYEETHAAKIKDEKFPIFTKELFFSVFPPPMNIKDRHQGDSQETDPNIYMKFMVHLGSGRLGKSYTAQRVDVLPYACTIVPKKDNKLSLVLTVMDAKRVDYIDAVRAIDPFLWFGGEHSPFLDKIIFCCRSSLPYLSEHYYFACEYCRQSLSLCHHLQRVGQLKEEDAKFYITELIEAVGYIHKKGKILRRLSLCNILLQPTGHIKLVPYTMCDQNLDCGQACNMLIKNCGDQFYASPEVVFGVDVQFTADWWSVGIILYQLLTGQLPFTGRTLGDLGKAITEQPLLPSDAFSGEAAAFMKHILHKDPRRRLGFTRQDTIDEPGVSQIRRHPFFQGVNWQNVRSLLLFPPFLPRGTALVTTQDIFQSQMKIAADKNKLSAANISDEPMSGRHQVDGHAARHG